ncbi:serine/threonine-protein kinase [Mycobacterium sp. TY815]|uniref:serine/threonine-protein kinase n=1 Tax=Mycobacterium sp. TY815 TaxID=3050581 RepID=UPI002742604F|nr:serine/threonine-protein kinase [Mycobacterium sp. TY815]MDP7707437.1 AAA domain-containing protein [Mycobacterium sp. TY815]
MSSVVSATACDHVAKFLEDRASSCYTSASQQSRACFVGARKYRRDRCKEEMRLSRRVVVGRYAEIANTRRVGGQWEVFQASDLDRGGRHVAVKVVPAKSDEIFWIYFERETAAMRTLSHANVAALLDSGIDDAAGLYYVVLEWIPDTLKTWLASLSETPGWDDVADTVALPLASALAHSHSLSVLHRDVKPGNVLWTGGKPLLADFALSKIKKQIAGAEDATVSGMTSAPWAPPDQTSRGSARFDVYGLAATLLQCVSPQKFSDYHHVTAALDDADTPPPVTDLLRRALDPDPAGRPADGQVFFYELQAIQTARAKNWHRARQVPFLLTRPARETLMQAGDGRPAEDVIEQRMGTATYAVPRLKTAPDGQTHLSADEFQLVGDQVKLVLAFEGDTKLKCFRAEVADFEDLEYLRRLEEAVMLDSRELVFTARPPVRPHESAKATWELRARLRKAVQDAGDRSSERIKNARLTSWSKLIDAKEQLEKRLEEPITYSRVGSSGIEFTLQAKTALSASILDQERIARPLGDEVAGKDVRVVVVDIDDTDGTDFTVRAAGRGADIPFDGVLVRDRTPSRAAIRRQKDALAALREGSAARPHLRELVLDPAQAQAPDPVEFSARTAGLDEDKKVAVSRALGSSDLFLVEGPPGTGKTSFICELVNQYLAARPHDKVLLVSQMHVAIDNAITRLHKSGVEAVVRLSSKDDRVDPEATHLLLSNKLEAWRAKVAERAEEGMSKLAAREGVQIEHLILALRAEEALATLRRQRGHAEALGTLSADDRLDNEDLPEQRADMLADYQRASERAEQAVAEVRAAAGEVGVDVPDELDQSTLEALVEDVLGSAAQRRLHQLVQTQGDWLASLNDPAAAEPMFLPTQNVVAGTCMGFVANRNVGEMQFDLCIIDEASRATAAELLVPMTRSKRWVMVGDTKQLPPMAEEVLGHPDLIKTFDLDRAAVSTSLFDTLLAEVPDACRTRLVTQHRMAAPIGELISQAFYRGELVHDPVPVVDPSSIEEDERLIWFSTSHRGNRFEEAKFAGSVSASNKLEVEKVADLVKRLDERAAAGRYRRLDGEKLYVLVLSGYSKQCGEITRALRRLDCRHVDAQVKTIDAVQGREADVVIFSVTRANLAGELGFLGQPYAGRINVALSRAREALWIVGDSDFCTSREGPLRDVLHHIASNPVGRVEYL